MHDKLGPTNELRNEPSLPTDSLVLIWGRILSVVEGGIVAQPDNKAEAKDKPAKVFNNLIFILHMGLVLL